MKYNVSLSLTEEKEISVDCWYCGQPFDQSYDNSAYAVEMNGLEWLHRKCALDFSSRLLTLATRRSAKTSPSERLMEGETPHFGPDE